MNGKLAASTLVAFALSIAGNTFSHEAALSRYNYREHVRPIFVKHCAGCHRDGGAAPMSLLEYQSAVPWSNAIKLQLLSRTMPPFLPEDESGPFRGARGLTAEELDILIDWTVGATPEGKPIGAPSPSASNVPEPDVVLKAASEVVIGEDEYDETECVHYPGFSESRILSALTVRSDAPTVLRRATLYVGESCAAGEPVLTWLPDQSEASFPEGLGREIASGVGLILELRYVKGWNDEGMRMVDKPALGLWFARDNVAIRSIRIEAAAPLAAGPVELVALYTAGSGGSDDEPIRVEAVGPDGTVSPLLVIGAFDPAWREKYFFAKPLSLPAGTQVRVSQPTVWADFILKTSTSNE